MRDSTAVSLDSGTTWQRLAPAAIHSQVRSVAIDSSGDVIVAADSSIYRFEDGNGWSKIHVRPLPTTIQALATTKNGALLAVTAFGIFRSLDRGDSWAIVDSTATVLLVIADSNIVISAGAVTYIPRISNDKGRRGELPRTTSQVM